MKKRFILFLILIAAMVSLGACKDAPENDSVVSKNNGSFDSALIEPNDAEGNALGSSFAAYSDEFTSTDGTVRYTISLDDEQIFDGALPVVQTRPHFYTVDDAKRISNLLFGDTELFDWSINYQMSKQDIEEKLLEWKQLRSDQVLRDLFGDDEDTIRVNRDTLDALISRYSDPAVYEAAPDTTEHTPCQWMFQDDGEGNTEIEAVTAVGDLGYHYQVFNRDKDDYRINNLSAYIMDERIAGGSFADVMLMCEKGYAEKPGQEELDAAKARAEELIGQLGMGQWQIDSCNAVTQYISSVKEVYFIEIKAVPVYNGIPVTRLPQLVNLKSEDAYAENYYYSDLTIRFLADGTLLYLQLVSPMDVVQVINDNVNVVTFDILIEKIKAQLELTDVNNFYFIGSNDGQYSAEVVVDEIELGLNRTRIKDNKTDFYYLPTVTVKGYYKIFDENGTLIYDLEAMQGRKETLLVLNAIDSSVVNTSAGY